MMAQNRGHRDLFCHDAEIGHRFVPGVRIRVPHESGGYLISTNDEGFRCAHQVTQARRTRHRILVFGDSYTAGEGVSNGKRFSDILEATLPETEVLNFGLPASGTDQQLLIYERFRRIAHDLVVLALFTENIRRNPCQSRLVMGADGKHYFAPKPWFEIDASDSLVLRGVPVPDQVSTEPIGRAWGNRIQHGRWLVDRMSPRLKDLIQRLTRHQPSPEYNSPSSFAWRLLRRILLQWQSRGSTPFIVVLLPWYMYIEGSASFRAIQQRFDELTRHSGIPILNALPALQAGDAATRRGHRFQTDSHYTPAAHFVVGRFLADSLRPFLNR